MKKLKILYCMQVSWYWIKQRPHFIAEGLSDDYNITVVDRKEFKKSVQNSTNIRLYHRYRLPFERMFVIRVVNNALYRLQYGSLCKKNDIIWITSPVQYKLIGKCKGKKMVYDCMDDMPALAPNKKERIEREKYERLLIERADVVFASSEHLKKHLVAKYGDRPIFVVNNAIKNDISTYKDVAFDQSGINLPSGKKNITYIGTISSWFDFNLLITFLDKNSDVALNLFGPHDVTIPQHPQIHYHGSVEHKYILGLMEHSDILVMPFVVNDLIRSVNPVKLYEYIYSGKPCIAPRYEESEQFYEFVSLYNSPQEFEKILSSIIAGDLKQKSKEECESFAMQNTWASRVKSIKKYL